MNFKEYLSEGLNFKQKKTFNSIKKAIDIAFPKIEYDETDPFQKELKSMGKSNWRAKVDYHILPGDILRISVSTASKFITKREERAIVDILDQHEMVNIKKVSTPAKGAGLMWIATDK